MPPARIAGCAALLLPGALAPSFFPISPLLRQPLVRAARSPRAGGALQTLRHSFDGDFEEDGDVGNPGLPLLGDEHGELRAMH